MGYLSDGNATVTVPVMATRRGVVDSIATSTRLRPLSWRFVLIFPPTWTMSPAKWKSVMRKVAARTRPDRIVDRILYVEVATSAWLQELNLLKAQLVMGLTSRLGDPRLFDDVRFKLAGRTRREAVTTPAPRPKPPGPLAPGKPASGATREQIVSEVSAVDDEELRELIARVRIANDR